MTIPLSMQIMSSALASTWTYWGRRRTGDQEMQIVVATDAEGAAELQAEGYEQVSSWDAAHHIVNV